jgi:hypothetical protein
MNIFPFPADIWGTVSDWVMIAVTAITAYFLWRTLKSQKEVQQTQNRLLKIEQLRVKEAFKPNLKYTRIKRILKVDDPDKGLIWINVSNDSDNAALNFEPIYDDDPKAIPRSFKQTPKILKLDGAHAPLYFEVDYKEGEILNCEMGFSVEYEDVAGTRYKQKVRLDTFNSYDNFITYDPEVINDIDQ